MDLDQIREHALQHTPVSQSWGSLGAARWLLLQIVAAAASSYRLISMLPASRIASLRFVVRYGDTERLPLSDEPFPYLQTEFAELFARLSPDGHWLAYTSDESKRNEIYVQSFPTPGGKWQVSTNGGELSVWSRDGKELYFVSPDGKMMAAEVRSGSKFEAGLPKPLFDVRPSGGGSPWFDVGKDGRFLIPVPAELNANAPMTVVINWPAGLKK